MLRCGARAVDIAAAGTARRARSARRGLNHRRGDGDRDSVIRARAAILRSCSVTNWNGDGEELNIQLYRRTPFSL